MPNSSAQGFTQFRFLKSVNHSAVSIYLLRYEAPAHPSNRRQLTRREIRPVPVLGGGGLSANNSSTKQEGFTGVAPIPLVP